MAVGTSWQAMLRAGVERDHYAERARPRRGLHRRAPRRIIAAPTARVLEQQLADGRWIQIREYRTSDGGTVGTRTDITELKRRESAQIALSDELRTQYLRFDAALNNMIQGLCMFDADQRLIVCNERYLEMYGFSPEVVKPGITAARDHGIQRLARQLPARGRERAIAERPTTADKREQAVLHQRLNDGRVIAVMHQPMAGGGSVATYEDVTQTVHAEEALRDYAAQARAQQSRAAGLRLDRLARPAGAAAQDRGVRRPAAWPAAATSSARPAASTSSACRMPRGRMRSLINDLLTYSRRDHQGAPVRRGRSRPDRQRR